MDETLARILERLADRVGGPLTLRLIVQPLVAAGLALRAGLADARQGRRAYFWALLSDPGHRHERLREGWTDVAKVFALAFGLDVVYQIIIQRWVYPVEALLVATVLALVPYLLIRGSVTRIARRLVRRW